MSRRQIPRVSLATNVDWHDSYLSLDERYRQLQKKFHEQEQELKLLKVDRRKEVRHDTAHTASLLPRRGGAGPQFLRGRAGAVERRPEVTISRNESQRFLSPSSAPAGPTATAAAVAASPTAPPPPPTSVAAPYRAPTVAANCTSHQPPPPPPSLPLPSPTPSMTAAVDTLQIPVHSAAVPAAVRAADADQSSVWAMPDPAMVWGSEGSIQNYVVASALYHANEELRRRLNESSTLLQSLQQELSSSRSMVTATQTRLENTAQHLHQMARERDLASQKCSNALLTIADMEQLLQGRTEEETRARFALESQITELRSRLVVGADSNDLLQKDVHSLLSETRERTSEVMQLRSKLSLAESALSSQKNVNQNMLIELKSLNSQLVEERRRLVGVSREVQTAAINNSRCDDLERQLERAQAERNDVEREHVRLMSEFVHVSEDALRHAREEVRRDVEDWKASASHWEEVSQLLYRDITDRTEQHRRCRDECDAAKEQRDALGQEIRVLRESVGLLSAKLDVVWPSHMTDAKDLSADEVLNVFGRKDRTGTFLFDQRHRSAAAAAATTDAGSGSAKADTADGSHPLPLLDDLPPDTTSALCQIQELHEANASLIAELQQLRLSNSLLQDRLEMVTGHQKEERQRIAAAETLLQKREATGHAVLEKQLERVSFLEAQVQSLRGYHVPTSAPVHLVEENENIFELLLGQLVAAEVPDGIEVPLMYSHVFCSADFLLHETIITPSIRGLNGFFDVTASFCVAMDSLLCYYLHTREILVQLHRTRGAEEVETALALKTSAESASNEGRRSPLEAVPGVAKGGSRAPSSNSSLFLAEQMYDTIAEGRLSLEGILLNAKSTHSSRPTLKGHVRLLTPSGRHIASLELQVTARRPFSDAFLKMIDDRAMTDAGTPVGQPSRGDKREESPQRSPLLDWIYATAETSSGAVDPQRRGTSPQRDMRLVPVPAAQRGGSPDDRSSSISSFAVYSPQAGNEVRGGGGQILALRPPPAPPPPLRVSETGQMPMLEGSRRGVSPDFSTTGTAFMHVERSLLDAAPPPSTSNGPIRCLWVDIERLDLPAELPTPIPRLCCYYRIAALQKEVWLASPDTPRYTVQYVQEDATRGTPLLIHSTAELATVVREPLVLFLLDDDAVATTDTVDNMPYVWAIVVCEWTQAIHHPDQPQSFALSVLRRDQTVVSGATLRLTLTASTSAFHQEPAEQRVPSPSSSPYPAAPANESGDYLHPHYRSSTGGTAPGLFSPTTGQHHAAPPTPPPSSSIGAELLQLEYQRHMTRGQR